MSKEYLNGAEWVLKNDENEYRGKLDGNGSANLTNIVQGDYDFTVSKKGYVTKTTKVSFGGAFVNLDIDLEKETAPKKETKKKAPVKKSEPKKEEPKKEEEKKTTSKRGTAKKSTAKKTTAKSSDDKKDDKK